MNGMVVHRRFIPSIIFAGTDLYIRVVKGTVRIKCCAQEYKQNDLGQGSNLDRFKIQSANQLITPSHSPPTAVLSKGEPDNFSAKGECGHALKHEQRSLSSLPSLYQPSVHLGSLGAMVMHGPCFGR